MKLILVLLFSFSFVYANKIEATLSPGEVVLGDSLTLTVSVTHDEENDPFITFIPRNAEVVGKSESQSMRAYLQGGKLIREKVFTRTYELQPVKKGYVHIRDIQADLGSRTLRHRSVRAKVLQEARRVRDFFLQAEVDKEQVYVGEGVNINYYIYYPNRITGLTVKKFPKLKDFLKRFEMPRTQPTVVNLQGRVFRKQLIYRARSFPVKAGKLKVDQLVLDFQYPDMRNSSRDMFGMTLGFSTGRYKRKTVRSKPVTITAIPLPAEGMPSNFSGLVGEHRFTFSIPKTRVLVNEALEARLEVEGEGALEKFDSIQILDNKHFEAFEPKTEISEISVLKTKKTIDYTYLANKAGKIPERKLGISYFDPTSRTYETYEITIPEISVFGSGVKSETISTGKSNESPKKNSYQNTKVSLDTNFIGPLYDTKEGIVFNNMFQNLVLFIILILAVSCSRFKYLVSVLNSGIKFSRSDFHYKGLHKFIYENFEEGETLRDRINKSNMPKVSKAYFVDQLAKAEKNEYKNTKIELNYEPKHFKNAIRAINESHKISGRS